MKNISDKIFFSAAANSLFVLGAISLVVAIAIDYLPMYFLSALMTGFAFLLHVFCKLTFITSRLKNIEQHLCIANEAPGIPATENKTD